MVARGKQARLCRIPGESPAKSPSSRCIPISPHVRSAGENPLSGWGGWVRRLASRVLELSCQRVAIVERGVGENGVAIVGSELRLQSRAGVRRLGGQQYAGAWPGACSRVAPCTSTDRDRIACTRASSSAPSISSSARRIAKSCQPAIVLATSSTAARSRETNSVYIGTRSAMAAQRLNTSIPSAPPRSAPSFE